MRQWFRYAPACALAFVMVCTAELGFAERAPRYYLIVYAAEGNGFNAIASHNFATFFAWDGEAASSRQAALSAKTISWLPLDLKICLTCRKPERGINLTHADTMHYAMRYGLHVTPSGPYEIRRELFQELTRRAEQLAAGHGRYILNDRYTRPQAFNCIHAITDSAVALGLGPLKVGSTWGERASKLIVGYLTPWIKARSPRAELVKKELGI